MSQLSDCTEKRKKNRKIIFGSDLSETNHIRNYFDNLLKTVPFILSLRLYSKQIMSHLFDYTKKYKKSV